MKEGRGGKSAGSSKRNPAGLSDRVAIFDLDGTIIDAAPDMAAGINGLLRARGLPPLQLEEATPLLGDGLRVFAARAFRLRRSEITEGEIAAFVDGYVQAPILETRLYPDVARTLGALREAGWRMVLCTNKVEVAACSILRELGVLPYFDAICGGDTVAFCKPDPRHIEQALARARLLHRPAVMVGDNRADVAAAQAYGMPSIFAAWGYGRPDMGRGATKVAGRFDELPGLMSAALIGWASG